MQTPLPAGQPVRQPWDAYLKLGYFDEKDNVRAEYLHAEAMQAARWLASTVPAMTAAQLRRFFNKMRAIERKLTIGGNFTAITADIVSFQSDAVYAVGRKVAPEVFKIIIDRNVALALHGEKAFTDGFMSQFEAIVAYFVYETRFKRSS